MSIRNMSVHNFVIRTMAHHQYHPNTHADRKRTGPMSTANTTPMNMKLPNDIDEIDLARCSAFTLEPGRGNGVQHYRQPDGLYRTRRNRSRSVANFSIGQPPRRNL